MGPYPGQSKKAPLVALRHRPVDLALHVAILDRAALVVHVLALCQRQLHLRARALEVDPRGHDREALLGTRLHQALDLAPVQQQLPGALRLVVLTRRLVGRDVHVAQPDLAVPDLGVCVLQLHAAIAQRLHLRALEHDAGLELVEQVEAEARLPVGGDVSRGRLALLLPGHGYEYEGAGIRSTRPRGASTRSTSTWTVSPRRSFPPDPSASSAVPSSFSVHQPRSRRAGNIPSKRCSPNSMNAPFSINPTTAPSSSCAGAAASSMPSP